MTPKVYVDNLAAATTEGELRDLFSPFGTVSEVNIVVDRTDEKPRGFGYVTMATPEGARDAIRALHGKEVATHTIIVSEAWPFEESQRRNTRRTPARLVKLPWKNAP